MREEILKQFFLGEISAELLAEDLIGSMVRSSIDVTRHPIEDMREFFEVRPEHLIRVCDAALRGEIEAEQLKAIGFCIAASDHFEFDTDTPEGSLVGNTVSDWSVPEINYPLTEKNIRKFRERLLTGKDPFTIEDTRQ